MYHYKLISRNFMRSLDGTNFLTDVDYINFNKSLCTHLVTQILMSKFIQGLHFLEAHFSPQQYASGINSPLSIGMWNHKEFLKHYSLILIIKYHTSSTVGIVLNKCYIHGFVQNAAHFFFIYIDVIKYLVRIVSVAL